MDIIPGTLLTVQGPRVGWFRRESLPVQVVAVEATSGIVHVSVLWEPAGLDTLPVEIGFVPLLMKVFESSIVEVVGPRPVGTAWWAALQEWRSKRAEKLAGVFLVPLWEARRLAWEVVHEYQPDACRDELYLESAFPEITGESDEYKTVRVVAIPRISPLHSRQLSESI